MIRTLIEVIWVVHCVHNNGRVSQVMPASLNSQLEQGLVITHSGELLATSSRTYNFVTVGDLQLLQDEF